MAKQFGTIEIKRKGDIMVVHGLNRTPRGKRFIAGTEEIGKIYPGDPQFKARMKAAVLKLLAESSSTP